MKWLSRLLLVAGLSVLCLPAFAQGEIILRAGEPNTDAFPVVQVDVTVRDRFGVPVEGLTADEFTITEDGGGETRTIRKVERIVNPNLPIAVVIVLDVSGSMEGKPLADAKAAATRFLDRLGAGDRAALIAFSDTVDVEGVDPDREYRFTEDLAPLYDRIEELQAGGHTPLYDVAYKAVQWAEEEPFVGNRAVLLLSDGKEDPGPAGDKGSKVANEDSAVIAATDGNVPVFVIALGNEIDEPYLRHLASQTRGHYEQTPDSAELKDLFVTVADLLKQQVRITYESGVVQDGEEHTAEIEVRAHERTVSDRFTFVAPLGEEAADDPTPTFTPSPSVTPTATSSPTATSTPTPTPPQPPPPSAQSWWETMPLWGWGLAGLGVLLLGGGGTYLFARRPKEQKSYCLKCGHEVDGPNAPCPICDAEQPPTAYAG